MIFQALPLRFEFEAKETVWFPPGKAANIFRGALGLALDPAAHARLFTPRGQGVGPSGFEDRPRPFVLRAASLDGKSFQAGETFALDVNVFDRQAEVLEAFQSAFSAAGPKQGRARLMGASQQEPVEVDLSAVEVATSMQVTFVTPMQLKFEGGVLREPRFDALFARIRDRVSSLCSFYQGGAPEADYQGLGERAGEVTMYTARIRQVEVDRRSGRTGENHSLGGFVGEAEYQGDLGEFLPWLRAAEWTGAGRLTVWGNGVLRVRTLAGISRDDVSVEPHTGR